MIIFKVTFMVSEVKKDICQEKIYTITIPATNSQIKDFIQWTIIVYIIHLCRKAVQRGFELLLFIHIVIYLAICGI